MSYRLYRNERILTIWAVEWKDSNRLGIDRKERDLIKERVIDEEALLHIENKRVLSFQQKIPTTAGTVSQSSLQKKVRYWISIEKDRMCMIWVQFV